MRIKSVGWITLAAAAAVILPSAARRGSAAGDAGEARQPGDSFAPPATTAGAQLHNPLREGATLREAAGRFEVTGDRLTFLSESDGRSLKALENLALERIMRMMQEGRSSAMWLVSGTVTEFQGENYLLITRAVMK